MRSSVAFRGCGHGGSEEEEDVVSTSESGLDGYEEDGEIGEEEQGSEFEDDPVVNDDEEDAIGSPALPAERDHDDEPPGQAGQAEVLLAEAEPSDPPENAVPEVPEVLEAAPAAAMAPAPAPFPRAFAHRQFANRRHGGGHEKNFEFGPFSIRFRDDRSVLYPDRIAAWVAYCPVHDGWNLTESTCRGPWSWAWLHWLLRLVNSQWSELTN